MSTIQPISDREFGEFMGRVTEALRAITDRQERIERTLEQLLKTCKERGEGCQKRLADCEKEQARSSVIEKLIWPLIMAAIAGGAGFWLGK